MFVRNMLAELPSLGSNMVESSHSVQNSLRRMCHLLSIVVGGLKSVIVRIFAILLSVIVSNNICFEIQWLPCRAWAAIN